MPSITPATIHHRAVLIRINDSFQPGMSPQALYEVTRGIWRVDRRRADQAELAFAVCEGIIREVYRIKRWYPAGTLAYTAIDASDYATYTARSEFDGTVANDIRHLYIGRSVKHYFTRGNANPIRYLNL